MQWLDLLERIGELPAEVWLVPPVVILALMAAIGWLLRSLLLSRYRAIATRTGLTVVPKILNASEIRGSFRGRELVMHIVSRQRQTFRKRWTRVWVAEDTGPGLPPISVVQIGDSYAIRDGHHRVSVARARGALTIDAIVGAA